MKRPYKSRYSFYRKEETRRKAEERPWLYDTIFGISEDKNEKFLVCSIHRIGSLNSFVFVEVTLRHVHINKINHACNKIYSNAPGPNNRTMQGQPYRCNATQDQGDGYSSFKLPIKFRNTSNNTASSLGSPSGKELLSA